MYHYILQVYHEPHKEDDWATEDDFIDRPGLIPIADHVKAVCDRSSAIRHFEQWFHAHHMGTFSGGSFVLAPDGRSHYFKGRFPEFRRSLKTLEAISETQYINDHDYVEMLLSDLVSSFSQSRDSYIMEYDDPPVPLDHFIRTAVPGVPYYIGAVMEYHC